jgi:hypothetical protein
MAVSSDPSFGAIVLMQYSAIAVIVKLGFTPIFPCTTDPSAMNIPL